MLRTILIEIAYAIGQMFINPIFYIAIFIAILLGYKRVKRERQSFHIRILWGWSEVIGLVKEGLLIALIISILSLVIGLTVPIEFLYLLTVVSLIGLISYFFHLLSPIVLFFISTIALFIMELNHWSFTLFGSTINGLSDEEGATVTIAILAGLLLIAEGLLIRKKGTKYASPIVESSNRGLKGVAFFSKQIWLLPLFFVVPGTVIDAYFPWWPQFSLGSTQFGLVLFPVMIGYQQRTRHTLPVYFYSKLGRAVYLLGQLVVIGGLVAYFVPVAGIVTLAMGVLARIVISIYFSRGHHKDFYAVSAKPNGVMIAAILPDSPAEKMGLGVGEVIARVNGVEVHNERELYEALQINAAHCKLEVLNHHNEIRLTQHVVHYNDHYRIGLLIAE